MTLPTSLLDRICMIKKVLVSVSGIKQKENWKRKTHKKRSKPTTILYKKWKKKKKPETERKIWDLFSRVSTFSTSFPEGRWNNLVESEKENVEWVAKEKKEFRKCAQAVNKLNQPQR